MVQQTELNPDKHAQGFLDNEVDALRYDWQTDHPREVAGILRSFMPSGVRVLDVGCGTGSVTSIVNRDKNNNVYGIEPDPARANVARMRGINVIEGSLTEEFITRHEKFDVVMFVDVLEHIAEPTTVLKVASKGLCKGGILLVSVPNVAHWSVRFDLLFGRFDYADVGIKDATHLRWFTAKTIRRLLEGAGFQILEIRQTAGVDLPEYHTRLPWRWMPGRARRLLIRLLTTAFPHLFGCQHILKAKLVN